jgi:hypothetical protein
MVYKMPFAKVWGVYETSTGYNRLVAGGFSSRVAAEDDAAKWKAEGSSFAGGSLDEWGAWSASLGPGAAA